MRAREGEVPRRQPWLCCRSAIVGDSRHRYRQTAMGIATKGSPNWLPVRGPALFLRLADNLKRRRQPEKPKRRVARTNGWARERSPRDALPMPGRAVHRFFVEFRSADPARSSASSDGLTEKRSVLGTRFWNSRIASARLGSSGRMTARPPFPSRFRDPVGHPRRRTEARRVRGNLSRHGLICREPGDSFVGPTKGGRR